MRPASLPRAPSRRPRWIPLLGACALAVPAGLAAGPAAAQTPRAWSASAEGLSVDLSLGVLAGTAREYVLDPSNGRTVSRLHWDMKKIAMFNAAIAYRPWDWLRLEARGSTNLSGASHMDDYDFDIGDCPPTPSGGDFCESHHRDTVLRNALLLDAFAAVRLISLGPLHVSGIAGYKHDLYRWQASGGVSNYAPPSVGTGISYAQSWRAPYLGIGLEAEHGRWSVRGRLIASVWAAAKDQDHHHNTATLYVDRMGPSQMAAAEIGLGYRLSRSLVLTLDYRYQAWRIAQGPTTEHDGMEGTITVRPGKAAGASNHSHMVSVGLSTRPLVPAGGGLPAAAALPHAWDGFHAGAEIGWLWQAARWATVGLGAPPVTAATATRELNASAARAGFFAGYSRAFGGWVAGVEADFGMANAHHTARGVPGTGDAAALAASPDAARVARLWDASLRARLGVLVGPDLLVYATGGLALAQQTTRLDCKEGGGACRQIGRSFDERGDPVLAGWTLGLGAEVALADQWFARAEYRYSALPTARHRFFTADPIAAADVAVARHDHRLGLGIGYRW